MGLQKNTKYHEAQDKIVEALNFQNILTFLETILLWRDRN